MLVLTRKTNESIVVGLGITVTVLAINGQKVRLGIEAPPEVTVMRSELLLRSGTLANERVAAGLLEVPYEP